MKPDIDTTEIDFRARRQALRAALGAAVEQWAVGQPASELLDEAQLAYDVQAYGRDLAPVVRSIEHALDADDYPAATEVLRQFVSVAGKDDLRAVRLGSFLAVAELLPEARRPEPQDKAIAAAVAAVHAFAERHEPEQVSGVGPNRLFEAMAVLDEALTAAGAQ